MAAKRGHLVLIKRYNGSTYDTIGTLRSKSVSFDGASLDVTTDGDVDGAGEIWMNKISGVKSISVNGEAILKAIEPMQSIYEDWAAGSIVNYEIVIPYLGTFTVPMLQVSIPVNGDHGSEITMGISMESAGAPTFVAETA